MSPAAAGGYLLVKGRAGLGNRILALLTGILYARLSGRRLVVDWTDGVYSGDGSNSFHRFFTCRSCAEGEEVPRTDSVAPAIWRDHLRDHPVALGLAHPHVPEPRFTRESTIDLARLDYEEEVAVLWLFTERVGRLRPHLRGGLAEMDRTRILRTLLAEELVLRPEIRARVEDFRARHLDGRAVGVHLRLSDRRVRLQAILRRLDRLLDRDPGLRVFAATDNLEGEAMLRRRYPGVVTAPHWYPEPGRRLHNNPRCPDRLENGIEALVDLYLLAGCDHLIGDTTSSFVRVAGLLAPEGRLIDVKPARTRAWRVASALRRRFDAYAADSALAGAVRPYVKAARYSRLPSRVRVWRAQAAPVRRPGRRSRAPS